LKTKIWGGALAAAVLAAGCGGGAGDSLVTTGTGGTGGGGQGTGDYQPLVVGATWTYHIDDKGVKYDKNVSVEALEDLGGPKAGSMAYRNHETIPSQSQLTWYQKVGDQIVRPHEQTFDAGGTVMKSEDWYDPYRLRVDQSAEHLVAGASWDWSYTDTKTSRTKGTSSTQVTEGWKVDAVGESVTVSAGTFAALRLTHVDPTDSSTKTYWFVRGVGKVREQTSGGHVEELASYQIPQ
jgi:hypothetical protein